MGLKVVRFNEKGQTLVRWGVVSNNNRIKPLKGAFESLSSLLALGTASIVSSLTEEELSMDEIYALSPVTQPARILCQGVNYSSHRLEAGMQPQRPDFNLIFTKSDTSLTGATDDIITPPHVRLLDYEIELGLVVGQQISSPVTITLENFLEYVPAIVITNDISARDVQLVEGQWFKGKSYRTFCPTGPYLYFLDQDEVPLLHDLNLQLSVNGEVRQRANTSQLLYKPEETLSELSEIVDFSPGDLIMTGTPGGVAFSLSSEDMMNISSPSLSGQAKLELLMSSQAGRRTYLQEGDEIVCEIKSTNEQVDLGIQRNRVVAAR